MQWLINLFIITAPIWLMLVAIIVEERFNGK
jgi:hypothetical protein